MVWKTITTRKSSGRSWHCTWCPVSPKCNEWSRWENRSYHRREWTGEYAFSLSRINLLFEALGWESFEFARILDFLCPFKVGPEVLYDRGLGSLGRRLLTTSTQEPNAMTPQSALCICSRKWNAILIVPIYFRTKTSRFCFRIISPSSLESELSFDSTDSEMNVDRARSTTVNLLLRALRAICNISSDEGENLFADELLAY